MSKIKTEYRGETITYHRESNVWMWQGSNRGLISLDAAEQSIDRALDGKKDAPKFKKQKAIYLSYGDEMADAEVTSQDGDDFWVSYTQKKLWGGSEKKRSKESSRNLYADTPENRKIIAQRKEIASEIETLKVRSETLKDSMQSFADWLKEQETQP
jgi:hypothetical protein